MGAIRFTGSPMPTCLACTKSWPVTTGALYAANSRRLTSRWIAFRAFQKLSTPIQTQLSCRASTVSAHRTLKTSATASKSPITRIPLRIPQTLTLLHKTTSFLDRALDDSPITKGGSSSSQKLAFWRATLLELSLELSSGEAGNHKVRIAGESVTRSCGEGMYRLFL